MTDRTRQNAEIEMKRTPTGVSAASIAEGAPLSAAVPSVPAALTQAELEPLLKAFNEVTARLSATHESLTAQVARLKVELGEANRQVERTQQLALLGEMAAGIAHEVRNPLGSIMLYARQLQEDLTDRPACAATAGKIAGAVARLDVIVRDVLVFARTSELKLAPLSAGELFEGAVEAARDGSAAWKDVTVKGPEACAAEMMVMCDGHLLHQALVNVVRNAVQALEGVKEASGVREVHLHAEAKRVRAQGGAWREMVALTVRDTGVGITEEAVKGVFTPFFTTKATGTGLGLAIVHRIVDAHEGRVSLRAAAEGSGAVVEILLPVRGS
ncbi:hypothetical protein BH11PLA1_BH11PLA1_08880 [soil metagenome]